MTVHRQHDPTEYDLDADDGLLCEARDRTGPFDLPLRDVDGASADNRRLVRDYGYWFWNYQ
jgi:hypothetical protein